MGLEFLFQNFDFLILLLFQFNNLQSYLVLAKFLSLDLLLALELLNQELGIVGLMVNLLVSALLLNSAQVDNVLSDADANRDRLLEVLLHFYELAVVMDSLEFDLFFFKFPLLL